MKEKKPPGKLFCADYKCSIYIGTDNIIRVGAPTTYYKNEGDLKEFVLNCGYKSFHFWPMIDLMKTFDGQHIDRFREELLRRSEQAKKVRVVRKTKRQLWDECQKKFSGMMLGIIDIDVFEAGFVVWFGVPTSKSFKEQSAFVRSNRKDILDYIQEEIQIVPRWKRAAALLPFCHPTEITVTRTNSVAVSYDIKEGIQRVLESEENHE